MFVAWGLLWNLLSRSLACPGRNISYFQSKRLGLSGLIAIKVNFNKILNDGKIKLFQIFLFSRLTQGQFGQTYCNGRASSCTPLHTPACKQYLQVRSRFTLQVMIVFCSRSRVIITLVSENSFNYRRWLLKSLCKFKIIWIIYFWEKESVIKIY